MDVAGGPALPGGLFLARLLVKFPVQSGQSARTLLGTYRVPRLPRQHVMKLKPGSPVSRCHQGPDRVGCRFSQQVCPLTALRSSPDIRGLGRWDCWLRPFNCPTDGLSSKRLPWGNRGGLTRVVSCLHGVSPPFRFVSEVARTSFHSFVEQDNILYRSVTIGFSPHQLIDI